MDLEKELRGGTELNFNNEKWCDDNGQEDSVEGWVSFNQRLNKFTINFNGSLIHTSKTFKTSEKKLSELMETWNCEFTKEKN